MMKRINALLLAVVLMGVFSLPVFSTSYKEYDYSIFTPESKAYDIGDYISDDAINEFNQYSKDLEERFGINLVFVITNDLSGEVEEFSDYIFLNSPLGKSYNDSIIMLVVDMSGRKVDLYTHGKGMQAITDNNVNYILDKVAVPALKSESYNDMVNQFAKTSERFIQEWVDADSATSQAASAKKANPVSAGFGFGIIFTVVLVLINIKKHRTVKAAYGAYQYVLDGSFELNEKNDRFLRTFTAREAIPKEQDRTVTSHSHSSGNSHGGGSRSF